MAYFQNLVDARSDHLCSGSHDSRKFGHSHPAPCTSGSRRPVQRERPYHVKQEAYKYENEIRFVLACEPLRTSLKGGVLLQVNPKLLIEEVVISPHIVEDEACAVRDLLSSLGLLPRERIKVSSLLNPGSSLNKELAQTVFTFETWESMQLQYVRDILSRSHQEKDSNGEAIPEIMRRV